MKNKIAIRHDLIQRGNFALLGIDYHQNHYVVTTKFGHQKSKRARKFTHVDFLAYASGLLKEYGVVYAIYEAGCGGFSLERALADQGIGCLVIAPQALNVKHKTDKKDSQALCQHLYSYVNGNEDVVSVCRVPELSEELRRNAPRLRSQLQKVRQQVDKMGKSLCLLHGYRLTGRWWTDKNWALTAELIPEYLHCHLEHYRAIAKSVQEREELLNEDIEAHERLPAWSFKGLGVTIWSKIAAEVVDFNRFANRRQVGGFTGLCPGIHETRGKGRDLSITKEGNRRLRHALIELTWLVLKWQPDYIHVKHKRSLLMSKDKGKRGARKKAIVALARKLAIDLWRLATGRITAQQLGLALHAPAA